MTQLKTKVKYVLCTILALVAICPGAMVHASSEQNPTEEPKKDTIASVVANDDRFTTLNAALKAAGLEDVLEGEGPFTVFAPTNDAFSNLPKGTVEELLKPENKAKLEDILTYHVYKGKVLSKDAKALAGKDVAMLNNKKVKVTLKDGQLYVNNAKVIVTDIMTSNGVIHVIDAVLLPES